MTIRNFKHSISTIFWLKGHPGLWTDYNQESWTKIAFVRPNPPPPNKKRTHVTKRWGGRAARYFLACSRLQDSSVHSFSKSDAKNPWELAASYFRLACFIFATSLLSESLARARYFPKDSTVLWGHPEITNNYILLDLVFWHIQNNKSLGKAKHVQ